MAKKKATNQPITAEEPARPDEQFQMDQSGMAPPSERPIGASVGGKTYTARSARERRTTARGGSRSTRSTSTRKNRKPGEMRPEIVSNMLEHPTKMVTTEELAKEYSYVTSDLGGMAVIAIGLIVTLVILAQVLPK